jgi:hypothetical protein
MAIEYVGDLSEMRRHSLDQFVAELEAHPATGPVEGRLVVADADPRGLFETMRQALVKYMKDDEYGRWRNAQDGRPVATGGKTFVADDDIITAVVFPIPQDPDFLGLASHELVEMVHKAEERQAADWFDPDPDYARELHGTIYADEYSHERVRLEINTKLGWTEGQVDREPGLVSMTNDILQGMPIPRYSPPGNDFWLWWSHLAQVWAMVAGRRAGGSLYADAELSRWAEHELIADHGWRPVEAALDGLYRQLPGIDRRQLVVQAAETVWDPIEQYGRTAWVPAGDSYP